MAKSNKLAMVAASGSPGLLSKDTDGNISVVALGTSGGTVPLLNTANSWSATQDFKNTVDAASLGTELTTNGTFAGNATGWTLGAGWAYSSNNIVCTLSGSVEGTVTQNISVTSGTDYLVTWDQTNSSANSATIQPSIGAVSGIAVCPPSTSLQSQAQVITAGASGSLALTFTVADSTSTGTIAIDNVSVKAITPIPAQQRLLNNSGTVVSEIRSIYTNDNIGINAGKSNQSNILRNVFVGYNAASFNTTGASNTGVGFRALNNTVTGSFNVAVGDRSGFSNTVGGNNTFIGQSAGYSNITGSNNTALGTSAGFNITTGSNVTCIGYNAQPSSATVSNEITLGDANVTAVRIPGTGIRFQADFSNATPANRFAFQTNAVNSNTSLTVVPTGTATSGSLVLMNDSDYNNVGRGIINHNSAGLDIFTWSVYGTGTSVPIKLTTLSTAIQITCATNGDVSIGSAALATSATAGFPWIPSMAGTPTGAPSAPYTHAAGLTWDYTNQVLYANTEAAWVPVSLPAASQVGFRNKVINGDFQIWQRGTTFTPTTAATIYCADRWHCFRPGLVAGITVTKQTYTNSNGMRVQRDSGNTSTAAMTANQSFETLEVKRFAGKTVTFSFKALKGANYSSASNVLGIYIGYGTGTDGNVYTGIALTQINNSSVTIAGSLALYSVTVAIPSNATQLGCQLYYYPTGTAGAADYFEISDIQLEEGSVATPFERKAYGLELSLCQRYYRTVSKGAFCSAVSTAAAYVTLEFPTPMRRTPDVETPTGALQINDYVANYTQSAAAAVIATGSATGIAVSISNFTGLTVGRNAFLNTDYKIGLSAEL